MAIRRRNDTVRTQMAPRPRFCLTAQPRTRDESPSAGAGRSALAIGCDRPDGHHLALLHRLQKRRREHERGVAAVAVAGLPKQRRGGAAVDAERNAVLQRKPVRQVQQQQRLARRARNVDRGDRERASGFPDEQPLLDLAVGRGGTRRREAADRPGRLGIVQFLRSRPARARPRASRAQVVGAAGVGAGVAAGGLGLGCWPIASCPNAAAPPATSMNMNVTRRYRLPVTRVSNPPKRTILDMNAPMQKASPKHGGKEP